MLQRVYYGDNKKSSDFRTQPLTPVSAIHRSPLQSFYHRNSRHNWLPRSDTVEIDGSSVYYLSLLGDLFKELVEFGLELVHSFINKFLNLVDGSILNFSLVTVAAFLNDVGIIARTSTVKDENLPMIS